MIAFSFSGFSIAKSLDLIELTHALFSVRVRNHRTNTSYINLLVITMIYFRIFWESCRKCLEVVYKRNCSGFSGCTI